MTTEGDLAVSPRRGQAPFGSASRRPSPNREDVNLGRKERDMKGPKPKYKIQLLENEITELHKLVRSHNSPQVKVMRARIVLDAHEHPEWSNQQISA